MTSDPADGQPMTGARHWGGFLLAGTAAYLVDSAVLMLLSHGLGLPVLVARLVAISVAMVVSWLINRRITFAAVEGASLHEFARFAAVSWTAAALNYVIFAGLIVFLPGLHPVLAIAIASLFAMALSYAGMRFRVFNRHARPRPGKP
jgi:putative flippase GtrA